MDKLGRLPLDRGNNFGMAMAGCDHGYARIEVKKRVAVDVLNHGAQAASRNQRITPRIGWRNVALIQVNDALGLWPGQWSDQPGQFFVQRGFGSSGFLAHKTIVHALGLMHVWEDSRKCGSQQSGKITTEVQPDDAIWDAGLHNEK